MVRGGSDAASKRKAGGRQRILRLGLSVLFALGFYFICIRRSESCMLSERGMPSTAFINWICLL